MKIIRVPYSDGCYLVKIPETASDSPITLQDQVILDLHEKITKTMGLNFKETIENLRLLDIDALTETQIEELIQVLKLKDEQIEERLLK